MATGSLPPKAFVSYAWDTPDHRVWVQALAARLRSDGVDITLDQWHAAPGDQLAEFMERSIRENAFVLIACTPSYKLKSDQRQGGVGYEGDIMTAEVMTRHNHRKFLPLLVHGSWNDSAPSWLAGKYYIDLRGHPYSEQAYRELLLTLLNRRPVPPDIGQPPRIASDTSLNLGPSARRFDLIRDRDRSH